MSSFFFPWNTTLHDNCMLCTQPLKSQKEELGKGEIKGSWNSLSGSCQFLVKWSRVRDTPAQLCNPSPWTAALPPQTEKTDSKHCGRRCKGSQSQVNAVTVWKPNEDDTCVALEAETSTKEPLLTCTQETGAYQVRIIFYETWLKKTKQNTQIFPSFHHPIQMGNLRWCVWASQDLLMSLHIPCC